MPALPSSAARMPPAAPATMVTASVFSVAIALAPYSWRLIQALPAFFSFAHDLFGKPDSTFPDHALTPHLGLQPRDRPPREGFTALHVGLGEGRLRARKADELPACEVAFATIDRVGKHAFDGVGAQRVEESLRGRPGKR